MNAIELFSDTKYYPLGGLSAAGAAAFCTVLPVGIAAWLPSNTLLGHAPAGLPVSLTVIIPAVFCTAAAVLFRKGMSHYAKNGSIRYTGFGHR